jgi:chromosome segregation ATPase
MENEMRPIKAKCSELQLKYSEAMKQLTALTAQQASQELEMSRLTTQTKELKSVRAVFLPAPLPHYWVAVGADP